MKHKNKKRLTREEKEKKGQSKSQSKYALKVEAQILGKYPCYGKGLRNG